MEKLKSKAEHLHAVAHELVGKTEPLERGSLREADRLMQDRKYEMAIEFLEDFVRIEGAKLLLMTPSNPNSLLAKQPTTVAKPMDKAGQTTIFTICGDELDGCD